MKTREKPPSSRGHDDKAEENAPSGKTPMARFRRLAASVVAAPKKAVEAAEKKERKRRDKS
jgi:hypothetical protein